MTFNECGDSEEVKSEVFVHLTVTGDGDPEEVTSVTGLAPSRMWRKGDLIERTLRRHDTNGYRVSQRSAFADAESAVDALFRRVSENWAALCALGPDWDIEVSLVIYAREVVPAINLRKDQVLKIAELNATLDIDLYCLGGD